MLKLYQIFMLDKDLVAILGIKVPCLAPTLQEVFLFRTTPFEDLILHLKTCTKLFNVIGDHFIKKIILFFLEIPNGYHGMFWSKIKTSASFNQCWVDITFLWYLIDPIFIKQFIKWSNFHFPLKFICWERVSIFFKN